MLVMNMRLSHHDRAFMEELHNKFSVFIMHHAKLRASRFVSAEDIYQETYLRLMLRISTLRTLDICKIPTYIVFTIRSVAVDLWRRSKTKKTTHFSDMGDDFTESIVSKDILDDDHIDSLEIEAMIKAIASLPAKDRDVLRMKYFMQYTDKEIAEVLGISERSVPAYTSKARKKVAAAMNDRLKKDER